MRRFRAVFIAALLVAALVVPHNAHAATAAAAEPTPEDLFSQEVDTDFSDGTLLLRQSVAQCDWIWSVGKAKVAGQYEVHWSAHVWCPEWARVITVVSAAYNLSGSGAWPGIPGAGLGIAWSSGEFFLPLRTDCFVIAARAAGLGELKDTSVIVCSGGVLYY